MINDMERSPVLFYAHPVDMRKGINGLSKFVASDLEQNPTSCCLYVFYNRSRNKIKVLYWELNGYCLLCKSLESTYFIIPKSSDEDCIDLSMRQLRWVMEGLDIGTLKEPCSEQYSLHY